LPEQLVTPDMTAQWESTLNGISLGEASYQDFMTNLEGNFKSATERFLGYCQPQHYKTYHHQRKTRFTKRKGSTSRKSTGARKTTSAKTTTSNARRRPKASS